MPLLTPISAGFVLDNRYEVVHFLGYGGFGRTYLARDRQRFNELCVLKEFAPQISSPEILRKAAELFQREAGTLYQLRHQQIPEFRAILQATIDTHDVLLIVEQYISGETYEQWVEAGNRLDEIGAVQFLKDILPVLSYVHDRGVIHRDISPDNLIREATTGKPFLIDFGSVKQIATTAIQIASGQSGTSLKSATQIHKPGFSPPEQLYGNITPSTDLYSLAVTTLVLMTGRSPLELYDSQLGTWHWRNYLHLNSEFADLLDRFLAYQATDRPASAKNASQLINAIVFSVIPPGTLAPYIPDPYIPDPYIPAPVQSIQPVQPDARPPVSQMRTVAVAPANSSFPTTYPARIPKQSDRQGDRLNNNSQVKSQVKNNQVKQDNRFLEDDRLHRPNYDRPNEDSSLNILQLPGKFLLWFLKGLWMGVRAIDWVLTWVWRAILIGGLIAGGAMASFFWTNRPQLQSDVPQQTRSAEPDVTQSDAPQPDWQIPKLPEIKLPTVKLPTVKLPELNLPTLPEVKLPNVKLPNWATAKPESCADTIGRYEEAGLTKAQFYQQVNARFVRQHPELNGRTLTPDPEDAGLRQDWCSIAEQILADGSSKSR